MSPMSEPILDGIKELVNIGIGRAAGSLNTLTGHHVVLSIPEITFLRIKELETQLLYQDSSYSAINQDYSGAFLGTTILIFPQKSADCLFLHLTGEERKNQENDELWRTTLLEVGNIIVNAIMGSIANILEEKLEYQLPQYRENSLEDLLNNTRFADSKCIIVAHAKFSVDEQDIQGKILLLLADQSIDVLTASINEKMGLSGE
jgi:chemotaxis protein CheC